MQTEAEHCGYNIIRELSGHGVGRNIHEKPTVPNYFTHRAKDKLTEGLVITIEPFLTTGIRAHLHRRRRLDDQDGR